MESEKDFQAEDLLVELKNRRIWACWRYGPPDPTTGKRTKVPFIADLQGKKKASHSDASTWRLYAHTVAAYGKSQSWEGTFTCKNKDGAKVEFTHRFDGIGFMCDNTFTFLDQDHCRNKETGEIEPEALARVRALNSYTEPSVSGEGLHTYAWGNIVANRKRPDIGVELYDHQRFCVFTGIPLPDFPQVMEKRQEQLTALHSEVFPPKPDTEPLLWNIDVEECSDEQLDAILKKACSARNSAKFLKLWNGDYSAYTHRDGTPDHSSGDLALCRMLSYWADNTVSTIDRLFRKSKMYRPKWERQDYRESTLKQALCQEEGAAL